MLGSTFYHQTVRKYVAVFGTLFNDLNIERKNSSGTVIEKIKVPLAYGPKQKWLLAIQESTLSRKVSAVRVPRMGFALTGLAYDSVRKLNTIGRNIAANTAAGTSSLMTQYNPVPYNFDFSLFILVKNAEDGTQILEQILPYFTPEFTVTINTIPEMGIKADIPIVLNSINYEDNYKGDFAERRSIIYTLGFTTKFYLYGPITSSKVIKTVQVDQYTDMEDQSPKREQRYTVTPKPTSSDADDDFGFNETTSFYQDAKNYDEESGEDKLNQS